MSQSAVQNPSLKPQTASNADVEAQLARKNSLESLEPRRKPREEGMAVLFMLCQVEIITVHGQYIQVFIDDQQGQIIIITVVVEGAAGQHLRSKCQFSSGEQVRIPWPQAEQLKLEQQHDQVD
jgi:hypothetical protein